MGNCISKDIAICLVIFNPAKTTKIIQNYRTVVDILKSQKLPVFTIELVYPDRSPEIQDAFHVTGNSYMFNKENLYRILETKLPPCYTKLAFIDADIVFNKPSWYYLASSLLDTHDVIHLFDECHWLNPSNTEITLTRKSVLYMKEIQYNSNYHPGFAWAMRRDWYNKVGFFDYGVSGSGDTLSVIGWMKKEISPKFKSLAYPLKEKFAEFQEHPSPRITFLKNHTVKHLYHGCRTNRQYVERHKLLDVNCSIDELLKKNSQGVFEWTDLELWNPKFLKYFISRNDDDITSVEDETHVTS
jgi:hypothetical protein